MIERKRVLYGVHCRDADIPIVREIWESKIYEEYVTVGFGDVVIDCGAQIGSFTLRALKWGAERVIAFEPYIRNFRILRQNTVSKRNVTVMHAAVWDKRGEQNFYINRDNVGGSSLFKNVGFDIVNVQTYDLDGIINNSRVDFIKMDIEGSELRALKGAQRILREFHPIIVMEAHPIEPLDEWWEELCILLKDYELKNMPEEKDLWQARVITAV